MDGLVPRVSDPYSCDTDPDPVYFWPKIEKYLQLKNKINFFGSKTTIYLSLGLNEGRPIYRRSLQHSKENIQHFKK